MDSFYTALIFGALMIVTLLLGNVLRKKRAGSEKYQKILEDFRQSVNAMLEPGEVVEGICGYKPCAAVTDRRLFVSTKNGIDVVPFSEIKSLKGLNAKADRTTDPAWMLVFEIKAGKKYVLGNHSDGFAEVVTALMRHTGK